MQGQHFADGGPSIRSFRASFSHAFESSRDRSYPLDSKVGNQFSIPGKMIDLNALLIFAKVVEANSFSEAARRLKMPISTVSRRIAELEDQLGVRLLERSTRSLRLTDFGSDILEHAMRCAELSEAVENTI